MGSGGGGGGTTADEPTKLEERPAAQPKAKKTVATITAKAGTKPGEEGRYTLPSSGTIKTPDRFEQIKPGYSAPGGISPGAVRAITGSDQAAANVAGRQDINKEQLGDLQTRASGEKASLPGAVGGALAAIGAASAANILKKIIEDTPTIDKLGDKPVYSVTPVINPRTGQIVGVKEPGPFGSEVYSGQPDFDPSKRPEDKDERRQPEITDERTPEIVPDDSNTETFLGTSKRRLSGRRRGQAGTLLEGGGVLYE